MKRLVLVTALFAAATAPATAAEATSGCLLTLQEAVREATQRDQAVRVAEADVSRATGERERAGNWVPSNPELTLRKASDRAFASTGDGDGSVEISQEFWSPGQRASRIAAADAGLAAACARRDWAARSVARDTAVAFVQAASADRRLTVVRPLLDVLRDIDEAAARRVVAGEVSEFEEGQVRIERLAASAELARLSAVGAASRQALELHLGRELDPSCTLMPPDPAAWSLLERLAGAAQVDQRPDVVAAAERLRRAASLLTVERRERRPRPTVVMGWQSQRSVILGDDISGLPLSAGGVRIDDSDRLLSVGLQLSIPVFDLNRGAVTEAAAEGVLATHELAHARLEARTDVASLLAQGRTLAAAADQAEEAVAGSDSALRALKRAADAGAMGLPDQLRVRERILRARLEVEDVMAAYLETEIRLVAATDTWAAFGIDPGASVVAAGAEGTGR